MEICDSSGCVKSIYLSLATSCWLEISPGAVVSNQNSCGDEKPVFEMGHC